MAATLDVNRLKAMVLANWRLGGMETLVKVMSKDMTPIASLSVGFCSSFKFIAGRTPKDMEEILGFASGTKLTRGAEIYLVRPLPTATQFELRGYTHLPGGVATDDPKYRPHPNYPPGLGAPQWDLTNYPQSGLYRIASVSPGERFSYPVASLPLPI